VPSAISEIRRRLRDRDLAGLFIEDLGWDRVTGSHLKIPLDGTDLDLQLVAQKREAVVCLANGIPDRSRRAQVERAVAKVHFEHVIAYIDKAGNQLWQWAKREPGRPTRLREYWLRAGASGEPLAERLAGLSVSLDEEAALTLTDVTSMLLHTFDAEAVTRAFYDRFKQEYHTFLGFISGIESNVDREWYASLMLNRLMFTYFIQKRGFLDGDVDYLQNRLRTIQERVGNDRFLSFYRHFLLRLFHGGFGQEPTARTRELDKLLGDVPYLNGGLFAIHELEVTYPVIDIPDRAFTKIFAFFDQYTWHLDERPLQNDREINPDVLGYIFEKYINQKLAGAYYTKEDVSLYMATATIIPRLFDLAADKCAIGFRGDGSVWRLLQENPDRYIFDVLLHGVDLAPPAWVRSAARDRKAQARLDEIAPPEYGLVTETWRECLDRRERVKSLRTQCIKGTPSLDEAVTASLDLRQLAQDAIDNCEGPELLRAFYEAVVEVRILDPACGSGAFLFAALKILEPLYEACLARMQSFVDQPGAINMESLEDFRQVLIGVAEHASVRYFVLRSIVIQNLYGVDIMKEAVEICKLRLFLKLVSVVEGIDQLEALPDIDFNIRSGNSLIGYASFDEVKAAVSSRLDYTDAMTSITNSAAAAAVSFANFRVMQQEGRVSSEARTAAKARLTADMDALRSDLDGYVASEMSGGLKPKGLERWVDAHKPFHWLVEFHAVMKAGGFDVVIGNPPYVGMAKSATSLECGVGTAFFELFASYQTVSGGNLYGLFLERSFSLLSPGGRWSLVVPVSITFSGDFSTLRDVVRQASKCVWYASFDNIPDRIFTGAKESDNTSKANQQRVTICVGRTGGTGSLGRPIFYSTPIMRWRASERSLLFASLPYAEVSDFATPFGWPKIAADAVGGVLLRSLATWPRLGQLLVSNSKYSLTVPKTAGYYIAAYEDPQDRSKQMTLHFRDRDAHDLAQVVLNSNLFFFWYRAWGDGFDVTQSLVASCPVPPEPAEGLRALAGEVSRAQKECTVFKAYRGVDVPNVNYNLRMDLLLACDDWLWSHLDLGSELPWRDLLHYKSSSWFSFEVAKSRSWPEPYVGLGMRTAEVEEG
jgi:hypothetical protein